MPARSATPITSSASAAAARAAFRPRPEYSAGSATFSSAVIVGTRLNAWNTNPILSAHSGPLPVRHIRHVDAVEHQAGCVVASFVRRVQKAENVHQRAFTGPRRSDYRYHLPGLHGHVHSTQRMDHVVPAQA